MPAGRPSKYKDAYAGLVIETMAEGKSLTAFAAEIGVARSTINEWMAEFPKFSEACKKAKAKCAAWWEERARTTAQSGGAPGQVTAIIFGLKNMASDDWSDRQAVALTGANGGPIETKDVTALELGRRIAFSLQLAAPQEQS